jgi:hypothetical protein
MSSTEQASKNNTEKKSGSSLLRGFSVSFLLLSLTSCGGGDSSFGNILDEATTETPASSTPVTCAIDSSFPSGTTLKVSSNAATNTSFGITPNNGTQCLVSWTLNAATISGTTAFQTLSSALFNAGSNTLVATISNGTSTATRSWTVTKNIAPGCASQTPAAGGNSILHTATLALSGTATNTDGDTLTASWTLNGAAAPTLFTGISTVGNTSSATFDPAFANVGNNQTVSVVYSDGIETGSCSWTVSVTDPTVLSINACLPDDDSGTVGNQVTIASSGGSSARTLVASNTGGVNFVWKLDGSTIGGATTDSLNLTAGGVAVGNHTVVVEVTDANNLPATPLNCTWAVKRNSPPVLSAQSPTAPSTPVVQKYRVSYSSSQLFSATVADANSDAITYTWKLDGVTKATGTQAPGALSYNLSPASDTSLLGAHTLTLDTTDGSESSSTMSWNIEINAFSTACNSLLNTPVSVGSLTSAPTCTLVGSPAVGDGLDPTAAQEKIKIVPAFMVDDGSGNLFISDYLNHAVWLYTVSGSAANYFGNTYAANKMHLIIGGGSNGVTVNNLPAKNSTKLNFGVVASGSQYLRRGGGIAFDSAAGILYVADWANDRVVRVEPSGAPNVFGTTPGNAITVIGSTPGGTTPANNAAGNTEGAAGTTHMCQDAAGLTLTNVAGKRWLYVTCYTTNSIKRMNADPSDTVNDANGVYGSTYTVVGRLNASGATIPGTTDGTTGPTGQALVYNPYAITSDVNGNIYWTGWRQGSVRMAAMSGSPLSVFYTRSVSVSYNIDNSDGTATYSDDSSISLRDPTSSPALGAKALQAENGSPVNASTAGSSVNVYGPSRIALNECTPMAVKLRAGTTAAPSNGGVTVNLTTTGTGTSLFYSDAACTANITSVSIPDTVGNQNFYYKTNTAQSKVITAAVTGTMANGTLSYTSAAPGVATKYTYYTPTDFYYKDCVAIPINLLTSGNVVATSATNTNITIATRGNGTFYSNSTCTTPSSTVTIPAGTSFGVLYYARTAEAIANGVGTIVGKDTNNAYVAASTADGVAETGNIGLRLPSGIAVKTTAGVPTEFYVSNETNNRVTFINASNTSLNRGGQTVEPGDGVSCLGTGTNVYNGDNNSGNGTSGGDQTNVNNVSGLLLKNSDADLYFADQNYRVRKLNIGTTQRVTTILGNGVGRLGFNTDNAVDAPDAIMNAPSHIIVDSTNKIGYIADTFNGRVRRINLVTGRFDTVVGNNYTGNASGVNAPVENATASSTSSSGYRAIGLYTTTSPNTNTFMLMTEQNNFGVGITRASLVRAWNMSGPSTTLFGLTIGADKVTTVGGDYSGGSKLWTAAPANNDGGANTNLSNLLYNPEGIAAIGSKFYVSNYSDHTIVEFDPSNNSSRVVIGQSNTQGNTDGAGTGALLRYPTVIAPDTVTGNFFFADNINQTTSKIRYANFTTGSVNVVGNTVTSGTSVTPQVQTVINYSPAATQGHVWGLAVNSAYVCYASGPGGGSYQASATVAVVPGFDGSVGGHNVTCVARSDGTSAGRVGPSDTSSIPVRGGGPFTLTDQEGVIAGSITLSSPVGLSFDHEGNLLVVEKGNGIVRLVRRWY